MVVVAGVFHDTFHSLSHIIPEVLYPVPDCVSTAERPEQRSLIPAHVHSAFLSVNRYERKKNIALALDALGLSCNVVHYYGMCSVSVCHLLQYRQHNHRCWIF